MLTKKQRAKRIIESGRELHEFGPEIIADLKPYLIEELKKQERKEQRELNKKVVFGAVREAMETGKSVIVEI